MTPIRFYGTPKLAIQNRIRKTFSYPDEVPVHQSVTSRSREFCSFLDGTGIGKNWSRKKIPVPVPEKIGPEKKYRSRTGKNLSRYRRIPGNSRSLYILISSCTFRHW